MVEEIREVIFNKYVLAAYIFFVIVNAADVMTTMIGLQLGAVEGDVDTIRLMNYVGVVEALLLKFYLVVFLGLIAVLAHGRSSWNYRIFVVGFGVGIIFYIPIVFRNLQIIWSLIT